MCFILDNNSKIKKIRKNKIVYKVITKHNYSPYKGNFEWEENKRYELGKSLKINEYGRSIITEGFHAYTTHEMALYGKGHNGKIIKLIVPKNAEYIENLAATCVSNVVETKSLKHIEKEK